MRLITYSSKGETGLGILEGEAYVPVPGLDMLELIRLGDEGLERARGALVKGPRLALSSVRLRPPIPRPTRNLFCLGWNYADHSKEAAHLRGKETKLPERPVFFTKLTTTVNGPYHDILTGCAGLGAERLGGGTGCRSSAAAARTSPGSGPWNTSSATP